MNDSNQSTAKRHPIQVAARRSGLSQDILRAWEKRYGVVEPARSEGRQRLYSDEDVERLRLLRLTVEQGRRISAVADLSTTELASLVLEDQVETSVTPQSTPVHTATLLDCLDAIGHLDGVRLQNLLRRRLLEVGGTELIEGLVAPLMVEVGRLWHEGRMSPSHEHLATEVSREILATILMDSQPLHPLGTILVATTVQQRHEVGALMAATAAAQEGWHVVYLGAELPAQDIVEACAEVKAEVLALSFAYRNPDANDLQEIESITKELAGRTSVLIGGSAAVSSRKRLIAVGALVVEDLAAFRS
ncbi:MAG TPA: MerR family transcriptional regulator, partial [Candidatus Krumholzibacteria bacterium]|nr:MerR family transcriptional regulator [Candidatus Krumholzibacteria bacterium]